MSNKVRAYERGYPGGKESPGVYQRIINEIRPHDIFISACLGHCAVTRYKKKASQTFGIDVNPEVVENWKAMQWDWIGVYQGDCLDLVSQIIATGSGRICIYVDPPYTMRSIKSERAVYAFTMAMEWHERLIERLHTWSAIPNIDIIVNHYPDPLYDNGLSSWRKISYEVMTRAGLATENLYFNYAHTTGELHEYTFIGENKDERYNLRKRTAKNLINKLSSMEPRKRQALLYYLHKELSRASYNPATMAGIAEIDDAADS